MTHDNACNPAIIYDGPGGGRARSLAEKLRAKTAKQGFLPLILIHDGGGTTFSYFCLGSGFNRPLYGLENPRFHQGGYWDGGIEEMAEYYVGLLDRTFPNGGEVLLGGWSLGGNVSLQMAYVLAKRSSSGGGGSVAPSIRVRGIIFIDAFFTKHQSEMAADDSAIVAAALDTHGQPLLKISKESGPRGGAKLQQMIDLNLMHSGIMLLRWRKPRWEVEEVEEVEEAWAEAARGKRAVALQAPPAIVLKARRPVPPGMLPRAARSKEGNETLFDQVRSKPMLGWGEYSAQNGNFVVAESDSGGHHFSMFDSENVDELKTKICDAANHLEAMMA